MLESQEKKMTSNNEPISGEICCICHHSLHYHLEELGGWRCHLLGSDGYQCECWLRPERADNNKDFYNLARRVQQHLNKLAEYLQ
jgi:hypothetical protein